MISRTFLTTSSSSTGAQKNQSDVSNSNIDQENAMGSARHLSDVEVKNPLATDLNLNSIQMAPRSLN